VSVASGRHTTTATSTASDSGAYHRPSTATAVGAAGGTAGVRDAPIRLHENNEQYQLHSTRADLYAVIQTTEALEGAWRRGSVSDEAYARAVRTLIAQFKSTADLLADKLPNPEAFWGQCGLSAQAARIRLCREQVPGTHVGVGAPAAAAADHPTEAAVVEERQQKLKRVATSSAVAGAGVAQAGALLNCAECFLTAHDALQLKFTAVDQMYPQLLHVAESLDRVTSLPPSFEGKATVGKWLTKLKTLPATYQLNEDEVRQLTYDLNMAYQEFRSAVGA